MIDAMIDSTRAVRPGEEIDAAALAVWLKSRLPGIEGPIAVEQFTGSTPARLAYVGLTRADRRRLRQAALGRPE